MNMKCAGLSAAIAVLAVSAVPVSADPPAGTWVRSLHSEARLLAGTRPLPTGQVQPVAGIDIRLAEGWKTYWRYPGDGGGIPPSFDWTGSDNVASTRVLYPSPQRFVDPSGETIGYKKSVLFPVEVTAKDPKRPVVLRLSMEYGICREICVPAEAKLTATIDPAGLPALPPEIGAALARVPRDAANRRVADPSLKSAKAELAGLKPRIVVDVAGDESTDLFAEAASGIMLGPTRRIGVTAPGIVRFEIAVTAAEDVRALPGTALTLTMVGAKGSSEARWIVK